MPDRSPLSQQAGHYSVSCPAPCDVASALHAENERLSANYKHLHDAAVVVVNQWNDGEPMEAIDANIAVLRSAVQL